MHQHRHLHAVCHNKTMKKIGETQCRSAPLAQDASMAGETAVNMQGMDEHLTASCWRVSTAS